MPKLKESGAPVFAGSINSEAALRVRVTKSAEDNTIARIIRLVEEAESILGITGLWIAILADTGATVLVTLNALRLLAFDPEEA